METKFKLLEHYVCKFASQRTLLFIGYRSLFAWDKVPDTWSWPITHLQLVLRLRINCAVSPSPVCLQGMHDCVSHHYTSCIREAGILFNWWKFGIICKKALELFDTVNCKSEFSFNFGAHGIIARIYWKMWKCIPIPLCNTSSRYWNLKSLSFPLLAGIKNSVTSIPYSLWVSNFPCYLILWQTQVFRQGRNWWSV
jgi:hypothetical protein